MGTIKGLLDKVRQVHLRLEVPNIIQYHDIWIEHSIREQLWDGKNSLGEDIRPSYLEDPFFKTPEQAMAYSRWKDKITPNPNRNQHTPNLFINGYFHSTIRLKVTKEAIIYDTNYFGKEIVNKYGDKLLGMAPLTRETYIEELLFPKIKTYITGITGLKFQ